GPGNDRLFLRAHVSGRRGDIAGGRMAVAGLTVGGRLRLGGRVVVGGLRRQRRRQSESASDGDERDGNTPEPDHGPSRVTRSGSLYRVGRLRDRARALRRLRTWRVPPRAAIAGAPFRWRRGNCRTPRRDGRRRSRHWRMPLRERSVSYPPTDWRPG